MADAKGLPGLSTLAGLILGGYADVAYYFHERPGKLCDLNRTQLPTLVNRSVPPQCLQGDPV